MPVYEYFCPTCKSRFDLLRSMGQMQDLAQCPECDTPSRKVLSVFAAVSRNAEGFDMPLGDRFGGGGCACGGNCSCSA